MTVGDDPSTQVKPMSPPILAAAASIATGALVAGAIFALCQALHWRWAWEWPGLGPLIWVIPGVIVGGIPLAISITKATKIWRQNNQIRSAQLAQRASQPPDPIGYTSDGQPIYPVVGYTPDGRPVTADKAPGVTTPSATGTNTLAIASFVCAFLIPIIGAVLGFVARSQISKTRENGDGLALAGIIIGIIGTIANVALLMALFQS